MEIHLHEHQYKRHDNTGLSWRSFIKSKILRRQPRLSSQAVEQYDCYGYLIGPDKERLGRPATDSFKIQKGDYESQVLLFGLRPTEDGRLSEVDMAACRDFIDEGSQYFGDEFMFSAARQIAFLPPASSTDLVSRDNISGINWRGAVALWVPGVIFINSKQSLDYESLKHVLNHELAHIIHGQNIEDAADLLEATGWKADKLEQFYPGWQSEPRPMNSRYFEGDTDKLSKAAQTNPRETIAEVYTDFIESEVFSYGDVARDALISYLSKRVDQPLAASVDWQASDVGRRR